ncbi:hypothetical protein GCM10010211_10370 [Streptomyces albospinus]|uniref:Uncharacterized protein n=1 Tax=Streptomyces albospinus TaxID=285515 RepID=A0ABQ2URQ6_9ACTN|nr:hypothetical protein [Streptomyces albospinus]GGU48130.1 hypothetical protein GCM10010211_10370 [Streptomyces albospinus]
MDDTPATSAARAAAALRIAETARTAAAQRPRPLPSWYPAANGLLFAAGFTLIGLQWVVTTAPWQLTAGCQLAGAVLLVVQCALAQRIERRPGIIQTVPRFISGRLLTTAYLVPLAPAAVLCLAFGLAGLFITTGVSGGLVNWLLLHRERSMTGAA